MRGSTPIPTRGTQCEQCRIWYEYYGCVETWTHINGQGPFCENCMKEGVTIVEPSRRVVDRGTTLAKAETV